MAVSDEQLDADFNRTNKANKEISRRDLLFPFRSRNFRRKAVERLSLATIVGLALNELYTRETYFSIEPKNDLDTQMAQLRAHGESVADNVQSMKDAVSVLYKAYEDEFYVRKTRVVPVVHTDADGDITVSSEIETYYEWEVPSDLPKHGVIEGWKKLFGDLETKCRDLTNQKLFDLTNEQVVEKEDVPVEYNEKATNFWYEALITIPAFAVLAYGIDQYEEILDIGDECGSTRRESMRNWAKVFLSAVVAIPVYLNWKNERKKLSDGKERLVTQAERIFSTLRESDEKLMNLYFGYGPRTIVDIAKQPIETSNEASSNSHKYKGVSMAFDAVSSAGQTYITNMNRIFSGDRAQFEDSVVPRELGVLIKNKWGTEQLKNIAQSESSRAYVLPLKSVGIMGLIFGAGLGLYELISSRLENPSDNFRRR